MSKHASADYGGMFRCCAKSIPVDEDEIILAGEEGEYRPCQWCKSEDSGVCFVKGKWIAKWRQDK
jgi:hypothetical protein